MAEIAMGGIHVAVSTKRIAGKECPHAETLITTTAGVERIVCETCGHLSFSFPEALSGPVHRRWFARPADQIEEPIATHEPDADWLERFTPVTHAPHVDEEAAAARAFAADERFHIRSRYELHPEPSAAVA
jgi:hypothetical protein